MAIDYTISAEEHEEYLSEQVSVGRQITSLLESRGFKIFKGYVALEEKKIKDKKDYKSLEDFKADRKAIDIFNNIIKEFESLVEDADQAQESLRQIEVNQKADTQTPTLLSVDQNDSGEGKEEE